LDPSGITKNCPKKQNSFCDDYDSSRSGYAREPTKAIALKRYTVIIIIIVVVVVVAVAVVVVVVVIIIIIIIIIIIY